MLINRVADHHHKNSMVLDSLIIHQHVRKIPSGFILAHSGNG